MRLTKRNTEDIRLLARINQGAAPGRPSRPRLRLPLPARTGQNGDKNTKSIFSLDL